jgi:hypothetical protein
MRMSYQNRNEEYNGWLDVPMGGDVEAILSPPREPYETTRCGIASEGKDVPSWPGHQPTCIGDRALSVALELAPDHCWDHAGSTRPARCCGWDDDQDDTTDEDEDADDFFPDDEDEDFDDDEDDDYDDEDDSE